LISHLAATYGHNRDPAHWTQEDNLNISRKGLLAIVGAAGLAALSPGNVCATPISGTFNTSGSVAVGATTIDFQPPVGPPNGTFVVSDTGNTGSFAALSNTTGTILDLNETVETPGKAFAPLTGFITFTAAPDIRLDLTAIQPGTFSSADCFAPAAAGQTCTPPGFGNGVANPFNLSNTSTTTSSASITVFGNAVNTLTGETDAFVGIFSTQFTVPYQTLLSEVASGTVPTSYSGTFNATVVPEPGTLILLGSGFIGLYAIRRRRNVS
jgi:hypothetical protein